jgi:hypothetical protein
VDDTRTNVPWTEVVLTTPPDQADTEHAITADQADEAAVLDAVDLIGKKDEARDGVNLRTIRAVVEGIGKDRIGDALERLTLDGRLLERRGPKNARLFRIPPQDGAS